MMNNIESEWQRIFPSVHLIDLLIKASKVIEEKAKETDKSDTKKKLWVPEQQEKEPEDTSDEKKLWVPESSKIKEESDKTEDESNK